MTCLQLPILQVGMSSLHYATEESFDYGEMEKYSNNTLSNIVEHSRRRIDESSRWAHCHSNTMMTVVGNLPTAHNNNVDYFIFARCVRNGTIINTIYNLSRKKDKCLKKSKAIVSIK